MNTYSLGILIDPMSIDIQNFHTDVVNSAELVAPDRLEIRATTMGDFWHCHVGDTGTYSFSLSSAERQLTLSPVTDACPERAAVLAGDWSRTDLGDLSAGRREAAIFRPFGGATAGRLAYAVPAGWTGNEMQDGLFDLGRPRLSDLAVIRVISNAYPSDQDAPCGDNRAAAGIGRTPAEMAAWLRTLPGLIVSTPTATTIGGLDGIMVDLSLAPDVTANVLVRGSRARAWSALLNRYGLSTGDRITSGHRHRAGRRWNAFVAERHCRSSTASSRPMMRYRRRCVAIIVRAVRRFARVGDRVATAPPVGERLPRRDRLSGPATRASTTLDDAHGGDLTDRTNLAPRGTRTMPCARRSTPGPRLAMAARSPHPVKVGAGQPGSGGAKVISNAESTNGSAGPVGNQPTTLRLDSRIVRSQQQLDAAP